MAKSKSEANVVKTEAQSGSQDSEDCIVKIAPAPAGSGLVIVLEGKNRDIFHSDLIRVAKETLKSMNVEDAKVTIQERNPLDFTLKARVRAAAVKGGARP